MKNLHLLSAGCIFTFIKIKVEKVYVQPKQRLLFFVFGNFFIDFSADIIIRLWQQVHFRMSQWRYWFKIPFCLALEKYICTFIFLFNYFFPQIVSCLATMME